MKILPKSNRLAVAVALAAAGLTATPAHVLAQENKVARVQIDEVIVTATRREASMQDIPMSINAFSGDELKQSGVEDLRDLQFLSAGLQVANTIGLTKVFIRGIGDIQNQPGGESGAAVHRDGVYLQSRTDRGVGFFDIERIEVVRGPQGTLYGRNATGGAINIITKAPTADFEVGGSVTAGNYDLVETEGYLSGPLVDEQLLGRVAFKTRDRDGDTPNRFNDDRYNNADTAALRARIRYNPAEYFLFDLTADYARDDSNYILIESRPIADVPILGEALGGTLATGRSVNHNSRDRQSTEHWGVSARAEVDLGWGQLVSLTAYRESDRLLIQDSDATSAEAVFIDPLTGATEQFSQELIISSSSQKAFDWIVGANYFHSNEEEYIDIFIPAFGGSVFLEMPELKDDAYAVFGEVNYPFDEKLSLTVGVRYSYEEKSIRQISNSFGVVTSEDLTDEWDALTPKIALTYNMNDELTLYGTIGKGFKAGGYNANTLQGQSFDPEEVTNYEVGIKSSLYGGLLRANLSLFHMDYSDLQVQVRREHPERAGTVLTQVQNAAEATIQGVELDFQIQPTESLSIDANVSYLDATFEKWPDATDGLRGNAEFDVSGNRIPVTPEWAFNLGASYTVPVGDWGAMTLRGEYSYKGDVYFTPFEDPRVFQKEFGLLNARLVLEPNEQKWRIIAWLENISDEFAATEIRAGSPTLQLGSNYVAPRTYGVTISFQL